MNRRDFLSNTSLFLAGATLAPSALATATTETKPADGRLEIPINRNWRYSRTVAARVRGL